MIYNDEYETAKQCDVALGCFDGVHRGHQALITRARRVASEKKIPLVIWALSMKRDNLLISLDEKFSHLERLGADAVISEDFEKIRYMSCEEFADKLVSEYRAVYTVCGFNFTFGLNAVGDAKKLCQLMAERGGGGEIVDEVTFENTTVSSTAIRNALTAGNPILAGKLLGRFYEINGVVEHGQAVGTGLGFPTANLKIPEGKIIPRLGVYRSFCDIGAKRYPAVTNIGSRPTFNSDSSVITVESFILDDVGDIYGKKISIKLADFIRPEKHFESKQELIKAINADVARVKKECGIR
jgi:riboflavin kinase/FMN adenylyltransferase